MAVFCRLERESNQMYPTRTLFGAKLTANGFQAGPLDGSRSVVSLFIPSTPRRGCLLWRRASPSPPLLRCTCCVCAQQRAGKSSGDPSLFPATFFGPLPCRAFLLRRLSLFWARSLSSRPLSTPRPPTRPSRSRLETACSSRQQVFWRSSRSLPRMSPACAVPRAVTSGSSSSTARAPSPGLLSTTSMARTRSRTLRPSRARTRRV
jgi:hypothetical protein